MKKAFLIIAIILNQIIVNTVGHCQSTVKIDFFDLMIFRSGKPTSINMGSSKNEIIAAFGKPIANKRSYFVKFDFSGDMIDYKGAQFYFMGNHLTAFELKNNQFSIKIKGTNKYAVIGSVLKGFVQDIPENRLATITLQHNGAYYNEVLEFTFNTKNKLSNIVCSPD